MSMVYVRDLLVRLFVCVCLCACVCVRGGIKLTYVLHVKMRCYFHEISTITRI